MAQNNQIGAFFERLKDKLLKKPSAESEGPQPPANPEKEAAARRASSSYTRLQAMSRGESTGETKAASMPDPGNSYQASPGGAAATRRPQRASSTFVKLQALSASGTGAASAPTNLPPEGAPLGSLLDQLES